MDLLLKLETKLLQEREAIEAWINAKFPEFIPPIFSSADIRQSLYKVAHVDSNLFPAGFNNVLPEDIKFASIKFRQYISKHYGAINSILIIPEDFTRNIKYFENIKALEQIIVLAGYDAKFGSLVFEEKMVVSQLDLELNAISKTENRLHIGSFYPDLVLLNNDLIAGVPEILKDVTQPLVPTLDYGWYKRRKSIHFNFYNKLISEFASAFSFDEWQLSAFFESAKNIDFRNKTGLSDIAEKVQKVLDKTKAKYHEYGISDIPYVFVKADNGTYGMGIITVRDPEEIVNINKKHRHTLDVIKSGVHNSEVIIQEGIASSIHFEKYAAENMVYSLGQDIISNTIRYNTDKDERANLNTHGMQFTSQVRNVSFLTELVCKFMYIAASLENS